MLECSIGDTFENFTFVLLLTFKIIKNVEIVLAIIKLFCCRIFRKYCVVAVYTAFKYLCNLAGTDYELHEDETIASKHVGAV